MKKTNVKSCSIKTATVVAALALTASLGLAGCSAAVSSPSSEGTAPQQEQQASIFPSTQPTSIEEAAELMDQCAQAAAAQMEAEYDDVRSSMGNSYEGYFAAEPQLETWYASCQETARELYAQLDDLAAASYRLNAADGLSDYKTWNAEMGDVYHAWDDACGDFYHSWDDLLGDAYHDCDKLLKGTSASASYEKAQKAWKAMYQRHSDCWSALYEQHSDAWGRLYKRHSAVWEGFYKGSTKVDALLAAADAKLEAQEDEE